LGSEGLDEGGQELLASLRLGERLPERLLGIRGAFVAALLQAGGEGLVDQRVNGLAQGGRAAVRGKLLDRWKRQWHYDGILGNHFVHSFLN
jgi:hypothetical protein